jgi:hypothetical protein
MKAHAPAPYDKPTLIAVRACIAGTATDGQQKLAMDWIITTAAGLYDMSYRDESEGGSAATSFHEGRRFVGNQIVKMTRPETLLALEKGEARRASPKPNQRGKSDD